MKLLYILIVLAVTLMGGYLSLNNFSFNNEGFSVYLIDSLFALFLCTLFITGIATLLQYRKKNHDRDVMTIRQYYDYKSAR